MVKPCVFMLILLLCMPLAVAQDVVNAAHWRFSDGAEFPGAAGSFSLDAAGVGHLHFDFTGGGSYVGAYYDFPEPLHLAGVSFKVRKPADAYLTTRIVDHTNQTLQEPLFFDHDDWQQANMDMVGFDLSFGGADDGLFNAPAKSFAILVEAKGLDAKTGTVAFKDIVFHLASAEASAAPDASIYQGEYVVTAFDPAAGVRAHGPHRLEQGVWQVDFTSTDTATLSRSMSLMGAPQDLILGLDGFVPGMQLEIRMASHFQGFWKTIDIVEEGKQVIKVPVPPEGWAYGGGENDGKVRLPLRLNNITLKRGSAPKGTYTLQLDPLRCRSSVAKNDPVILLPTLTQEETGRLRAACTAHNLLEGAVFGTVCLKARDWEGAVIAEYAQPWTLPGRGVPISMDIPIPLPEDRNFVEVECAFMAEGLRTAERRASYTRPLAATMDTTLQPASPWGMGVYLYRYPQGETMERAARMAAEAGVKWSREEFSWGRIETAPGVYDFSFYDSVVDTAQAHGISVYGLLSYWGRFTEPYTQQGIDDFCTWTRHVVRQYKDRIKHWEVYNEPNIFFWQGPKELYPVLLKQCYAAIKEEDPEAEVLGISTAGIDTKFIQFCLDADAPLDILTIHPYRGHFSERIFIKELREAAAMVENKQVWITEMGWSTQVGATPERHQAQLLARCYLSAVASGACQNISWYDFRNDGVDPFYNEANFGVVHRDFTPKPSYRALATVCRTFSDGMPQPIDLPGRLNGLQHGTAAAIWSSNRFYAVPIALEESTRLINLMGETIQPDHRNGGPHLMLRPGAPVFIQGGYEITGEPERLHGSVERTAIMF